MKKQDHEIDSIVADILADYAENRDIDLDQRDDCLCQPDSDAVIDIVNKLLRILYPGYYREKAYSVYHIDNSLTILIEDVYYNLHQQIMIALRFSPAYEDCSEETLDEIAGRITTRFLHQIPEVRAYLETDLEAFFDGDPAAESKDEIILAYPGLLAITIYRLAHVLWLEKVPLIPRIMSEYAHSSTGIDIHPGATIGKYFFIDHGTGIVIGETTIIGEHVKIYQGVTLGGLSTRGGRKLRNVRRHPTIGDYVTIYAGASILGGETVIGSHSVIGSNVFITKPVPAGARISIRMQELNVDYKERIRTDEPSDQGNTNEIEARDQAREKKTKHRITSTEIEPDESWFYII